MKNIQTMPLGKTAAGLPVTGYMMSNEAGMKVLISDLGGTIWQLHAPDRNGVFADVVCGYDTVEALEASSGYIGALIGRWGNRIANATFDLDGKTYTLYANNNGNHLHGGKVGFDRRIWDVTPVDGDEPSLVLKLTSPDGEEGYPGNLEVVVTYTLRADNALVIRYQATTDQATYINLTNHAYFNLGGYASGSVLDHVLCLDVSDYLRTDAKLIPTGERVAVEGTPFDFRTPKTVGRDFTPDDRCNDMKLAGGYDHCLNFASGEATDGAVPLRGYLEHSASGRRMEVYTNQPCVQLYSGNFLEDDGNALKGGVKKQKQMALCLETQKMPDSMHHEGFTNAKLLPGEVYDYTTVYRFTTTD